MSKPRVETKSKFATRLGVHRSTVTRGVKDGRIVTDLNGRVLIEESLKRWHATRGPREDMQAAHAAKRGQSIPSAPHTPADDASDDLADGIAPEALIDSDSERARYRAITIHWENEKIRLDMDLAAGQRLERDDVLAAASGIGGNLRSAVERLIDETAPRLAVTTGSNDRRAILAAALDQLTTGLRDDHARAFNRLRKTQ